MAVANKTQVTPDAIFQVAMGFMAAKHLFVANEIGVFTALADGPASLDEIATATGVPARTARIVTDAMVSLGFLERDSSAYRNGPVAEAFLSGRGPMNARPLLRFWNAISYPAWLGLEHAVRTGAPEPVEFSEELQAIFSEGVEAFTAGAAQALGTSYDFRKHRSVLDAGGGTGSFLAAILAANPNLEGTLFDLPEVVEIAERKLAASPVANRARVVGGDLFSGELPPGHDAVVLANVIHYFLPERNVELLRRLRTAVEPGARLLVVDFWTDSTHTQPLPAALMAGEFLAQVGGDVYSEDELHGWLSESGWRPVETLSLAGPQSAIVGEAV
jgi:SAM-dependent methyltransferase